MLDKKVTEVDDDDVVSTDEQHVTAVLFTTNTNPRSHLSEKKDNGLLTAR